MRRIDCKSLCFVKLGIAFGITGALATFIIGILGWLFGFGLEAIRISATMHPGFAPTFLGSIIGAIWAFVEIFLFIVVGGFIYCLLAKCCDKESSSEEQK